MDSGRIIEIIILAAIQLVGIVIYVSTIRGDVKALTIRQKESDEHHRKHYEHAEKDAEKFGEIGKQLGIVLEQNKNAAGNLEILRQSFHEIRNAMQIVLGKAALSQYTKPRAEDQL